MDYGRYSDKYSGRHGASQRTTKAERRELKAKEALAETRRKAIVKAAYAEAKAKAKGKLGGILDELRNIFRRAA